MRHDFDTLKVVSAGAGNALIAVFASLAEWQAAFSFILTLFQIAVAGVTAVYIFKKVRKK